MRFSTDFIKKISMRVGGLWGDDIETQIVLNSDEDNTDESIVNIDTEHIKCKFTIPNYTQISNRDINKKIDSFLFEINKLNKKDYYNYSELINILIKLLLGDKTYSDELLGAVLDNEYDVDDYVYDETDCEQEEN